MIIIGWNTPSLLCLLCVGCELLVYPGAFNMTTGPAHWELLQRARSVASPSVYIPSPALVCLLLVSQRLLWCFSATGPWIIRCTWPRLHRREMRAPATWPGVTARSLTPGQYSVRRWIVKPSRRGIIIIIIIIIVI